MTGWGSDEQIVAVGLLTKADLAKLGRRFDRAYPVEDIDGEFMRLLDKIDVADKTSKR